MDSCGFVQTEDVPEDRHFVLVASGVVDHRWIVAQADQLLRNLFGDILEEVFGNRVIFVCKLEIYVQS